jgi:sensor histidine kinase YesM
VNWAAIVENKNRLFWVFHTTGWLAFAFVCYLNSLLHDLRDIFVVIILLNAYAGWLLSLPLRYLYRRIWSYSPVKIVTVVILTSLCIGVLWQVIININYWQIYKHGYQPEHFIYYTKNSMLSFSIILGWSILYFAFKYYKMLQVEKENVLRANAVAHLAQLKMLRYQLNPHFLFNTLNAISTLIMVKDDVSANLMVTKLSHFLRYSLDKDPVKEVTLDSELQVLALYLDIEEVRFGERLKVIFNVAAECQQALVPSMILQPLAENSIKHAIAKQEQGGTITINVNKFGQDLLIDISDDGPGANIKEGQLFREKGVGLVNTRERLQALYADNFALVVTENTPKGITVNIRMPFHLGNHHG